MTSPAIVRTADLKRMADFIRKHPEMRIEIEKDGVIVRVSPNPPPVERQDELEKYRNIDLL